MRATHDYTLHVAALWLARNWPRWAFPASLRLALLTRLQPMFIAASTQPDWVAECVRHVADGMGRREHGELCAPDQQAVAAYRRGLVSALVEPKGVLPRQSHVALPGSCWSSAQLRRLDLLGYQHGIFIRYADLRMQCRGFAASEPVQRPLDEQACGSIEASAGARSRTRGTENSQPLGP